MRRCLFVGLLGLTMLAGSALAGPIANQEKPVVAAATAWLAGIDAGQYGQSWQEASSYFRGSITDRKWSDILHAVRMPLGAVVSRNVTGAEPHTSLPGAPDGQYLVMTFATSFAAKQAAVETVTFVRDQDGVWRAVGYFIK